MRLVSAVSETQSQCSMKNRFERIPKTTCGPTSNENIHLHPCSVLKSTAKRKKYFYNSIYIVYVVALSRIMSFAQHE
jgi:hypothetical protein